jgi:hypothetical protein
VLAYKILDSTTSPDPPLGQAVEVFIRREDADRFIEDVRRDEPALAVGFASSPSSSTRAR